jgi:hypothetical protein
LPPVAAGVFVGATVAAAAGVVGFAAVGTLVAGGRVGARVGALVGAAVGARVGTEVGTAVGAEVGTAVAGATLVAVDVGDEGRRSAGTGVGVAADAHPLNKSVRARIPT